jgi:hypothetical protein
MRAKTVVFNRRDRFASGLGDTNLLLLLLFFLTVSEFSALHLCWYLVQPNPFITVVSQKTTYF